MLICKTNCFDSVCNQYVVDVGLAKSNLHLRVATAPCLLGYGEVGKWLYNDPKTKREGNPYWAWIEVRDSPLETCELDDGL